MSILPTDFDTEMYKNLNPDLNKMSDEELKNHYIDYGISEKRLYSIKLPDNFDSNMYLEFNPDLKNLTPWQLKKHYYLYGQNENRQYLDLFFDQNYFLQSHQLDTTQTDIYTLYAQDIRQHKNSEFEEYVSSLPFDPKQKYILFINHNSFINSASLFLINLVLKLSQNKFKNTCFLFLDYDNISISLPFPILSYKKDPTLLYHMIQYYNPHLIYINSCNYAISKVVPYLDLSKCILHSHEILQDYYYYMPAHIQPNLVVSEIIRNQYVENFDSTPAILSPFILDVFDLIVKGETLVIKSIENNFGVMDTSKITIGMSGKIFDRNNYHLFITIAEKFPQYNFLWIGDSDSTIVIPNVYFVTTSFNNYIQYLHQIVDYYILFSIYDPCPYIILENILFETPCIVFSENMYYNFLDVDTKNFYFEWNDVITEKSCMKAIKAFVKHKKQKEKFSFNGLQYILHNFMNPDLDFLIDAIKFT